MTSLTPVAVQNADVLRRLAPGAIIPSVAALARDLGRDKSNFARTVNSLVESGLVHPADGGQLTITDEGRAMVRRLDAADNAEHLNPGAVMVRHDQLRPNPFNPRKHFNEEEIQALAETIRTDGVLQNLTVSPPDLLGYRLIFIGERRWRAVGSLIAGNAWDTDRPLPCVEREPSDDEQADALFLGLVENGRREPLTWLEEARAYHALQERTGRSAREMALRTGKEPRVVQEMVKVLKDAAPEQIAELESGEITVEQLRYAVRTPAATPAPPAGLSTDRINERMRAQQEERETSDAEHYAKLTEGWPTDEAELLLMATSLLRDYDLAIRNGDAESQREAAEGYEAVVQRLNGGTRFGSSAWAEKVAEHCAAPDGALPMWGQQGRFLIQGPGFRSIVVAKGGMGHSSSLDFYAVDVDAPYISNTGYRSHFARPELGQTFQAALPRFVYFCRWDSLKGRHQTKLEAIEDAAHVREAASPTWLADATAFEVADYTPPTTPEPKPTAPKAAAPQTDIEDFAPRPSSLPVSLTPHEQLALVELAHKIGEEGTAKDGALCVPVGKIWLDDAAQTLIRHGFMEAKNLGGWHANTTWNGRGWLDRNGFALGSFEKPITAEMLETARAATHCEVNDNGYVTEWLNAAPPAEAEPVAVFEEAAIDDDTDEPTPLFDAALGLASQARLWGCVSKEPFAALAGKVGLNLPVEIRQDEICTAIVDCNEDEVVDIDPNGLFSTDHRLALAQLVALAINAAAGHLGAEAA